MRFTHIDVNFDVWYEGHQNCPKILSMNILRVFSDHHLWRQNWRQYLWTSLCQFNFFVNLLHSLGVSFFDIWHLFDNLTSFWQIDIFLTNWHLFAILGANCPWALLPMWSIPLPIAPHVPIAHVPIPPVPIAHRPHTPVPHCPYPLYPMCPIAHRPHGPCGQYPLYPIPPVHYCPMCPIAHHPCPPLGNGPYG